MEKGLNKPHDAIKRFTVPCRQSKHISRAHRGRKRSRRFLNNLNRPRPCLGVLRRGKGINRSSPPEAVKKPWTSLREGTGGRERREEPPRGGNGYHANLMGKRGLKKGGKEIRTALTKNSDKNRRGAERLKP